MTIDRLIGVRSIRGVLHFTTNRGLVGVLAVRQLMSRFRLSQEQLLEYVLHVNAAYRAEAMSDFDKSQNWLDYVNLSISEVNTRFLAASRKWHNSSDVWWCILEFDPNIMTHEGVYFATTNNSYSGCVRGLGVDGLSALFRPKVARKADWMVERDARGSNLPTCEQAEVLYPESVGVEHLRRIYVEESEHYDIVGGWLREFGCGGVNVSVSSAKFKGCPN